MLKLAGAKTGLEPKLDFLKKNLTLVIIALVLIGGVAAALVIGGNQPKPKKTNSTTTSSTGCGNYRKDGIVTINNYQINVETAYNEAARIKGLSGRPCILANEGFLMDFGSEGHYFIWMKDMKFPIDVVWIDSYHKIAAIEIDFQPSTYNYQKPQTSERRVNQNPARYVLEVKANTAKLLHWGLGMPVHFQKT